MNALMMGCAIGWLPVAVYFMSGEEDQVECLKCNLIASFSQLGKVAFAIPGGMLVDKYGRKKATIGVALLNFISWMGISLWTEPAVNYVGQFILGATQALTQEACLIIVGETASPSIRGQLSTVYQIFLTIGVLIPALLALILSSYEMINWIITFFSFITLLSMSIASETPSFLISQSNSNQARKHLLELRQGYPIEITNTEFENLKKYIENDKACKSQLDWWKFLKMKSTWQPLSVCILIKFFTAGTGRNIFTTFVTSIFSSNGSVSRKLYPLIMEVIILLINVITPFYIDTFPRRTLFIFGAISISISNAFSAIMNYFFVKSNDAIFNWLFLLGNFSYLLLYNGTVQPISSVIKTELFPRAVKGLGGSLSIISQAISTIILYQIYYFIDKYLELYCLYAVLTIYSVILYFIVYFFLPESRGSTLADIQSKFQNGSISYVAVESEINENTSFMSKMFVNTKKNISLPSKLKPEKETAATNVNISLQPKCALDNNLITVDTTDGFPNAGAATSTPIPPIENYKLVDDINVADDISTDSDAEYSNLSQIEEFNDYQHVKELPNLLKRVADLEAALKLALKQLSDLEKKIDPTPEHIFPNVIIRNPNQEIEVVT
ncbi:facilitated trehalose transporter Tret1-like [Planococcus citri]|uniref:facilitated trehalose transporter Tret1-like n=1 Tax=Planococcus citri TaxID=170843 RepID=UPI0031F7E663